jgi:hypothetical protein
MAYTNSDHGLHINVACAFRCGALWHGAAQVPTQPMAAPRARPQRQSTPRPTAQRILMQVTMYTHSTHTHTHTHSTHTAHTAHTQHTHSTHARSQPWPQEMHECTRSRHAPSVCCAAAALLPASHAPPNFFLLQASAAAAAVTALPVWLPQCEAHRSRQARRAMQSACTCACACFSACR